MAIGDAIFSLADDLSRGLAWLGARRAGSFCRIETSDGGDRLVGVDGSLASSVAFHGSSSAVGKAEFEGIVNALSNGISGFFDGSGQSLEAVFSYDPEDPDRHDVDALFDPMRITAANIGLDADWVLDEWRQAISRWTAREDCWFTFWTSPGALTRTERKAADKAMKARVAGSPTGLDAQTAERLIPALYDAHEGFVEAFLSSLPGFVHHERLTAHEILHACRREIDPAFTGRDWRPLLPGDPIPLRIDEMYRNGQDLSEVLYPSIPDQLFAREAREGAGGRYIRIGDRLFAGATVDLPPSPAMPFNTLFQRLRRHAIPWRIAFRLYGDGMGAVRLRANFAKLLYLTSRANKRFDHAIGELDARQIEGEIICALRMTLTTWTACGDTDPEQSAAALRIRMSRIVGAVQSWGSCDVGEVVGDPLLAATNTLPAFTDRSPAPAAAAPLGDALSLLPVGRPASSWGGDGHLPFRTPDGKPWPVGLHSSRQAAWIDLGIAPMGGGKSVMNNTLNFALCVSPGLQVLPYISITDIGPSSKGMIEILRSTLPKEKRHLAVYRRLRMSDGINPFETLLGCEAPTENHRMFLINLCALIATPLDRQAPEKGVPGLVQAAIEAAYDERGGDRNPRRYARHADTEVDAVVDAIGMELDSATTWWEVEHALFDGGYAHEAQRAHRYAVVTLGDVAATIRNPTVSAMYPRETVDFVWRSLIEAIRAYPVIQGHTQFDLGDARIVSLDLDDVAPRGGPAADRQTAVMYMLARHAMSSRYFLSLDDLDAIPDRYRAHHEAAIKDLLRTPKRMAFDEAHRMMRGDAASAQVIADLETSSRESRKRNLSVALFTQAIDDIPKVIVETLATSVYFLGGGTETLADGLARAFGLNEPARRALTRLGKPGQAGANFVGLFRTESGTAAQVLTNTLGRLMVWAFSSTREDNVIWDAVRGKLGFRASLELLADAYPGGVKKEYEARARRRRAGAIDEQSVDVLDEIARELVERYRQGRSRPA